MAETSENASKGIKRDSSWISELVDSGKIEKVHKKSKYDTEGNAAIVHFSFSDGRKFGYVLCSHCDSVLSSKSGGHWKRHQEKLCIVGGVNQKVTKESQATIRSAIADYCIASGVSFNHTESQAFRTLIRASMNSVIGSTPIEKIQLPCRQSIRDLVETKCDDLMKQIGKEVKTTVQTGNATLIIDFGKHVANFLSVFISFILHDEKGAPYIRILPFSFSPVEFVKSSENVRDEIIRCGARMGLTSEQVLSLNVISDGAANMTSMGTNYFASWGLCACHSIQKMSERVLNPKKKMKELYSEEEMNELQKFAKVMCLCAKLAVLVHRHKANLRVTKLPRLFVETRWQSYVRCAQDIEFLLPCLLNSRILKVSELAAEINLSRVYLRNSIQVLEKFDPLLNYFEESTTSIHLFLPIIQGLNDEFLSIEIETDDVSIRALNRSARLVTDHYLEKKISEIHLKATLLAPRMKKMTKLTEEHRKKAKAAIMKHLETVEVSIPETKETQNLKKPEKLLFVNITSKSLRFRFDHLFDDIDVVSKTDEFETYMSEKVTTSTPTSPLEYWTTKRDDFPCLSKIAFSVFSTLSSESICERSFSAVKRIVRDDRHRLDPDFVEKIMLAYFYSNGLQ